MARIILILFIFLTSCDYKGGIHGDERNGDEREAIFKWGEWRIPIWISIVDDSLALISTYKTYSKEWNVCGFFDGCTTNHKIANYRIGLFLVNYREKQKPVWGDTLECNFIIIEEYFKDSSVLVFDRSDNKFGFWKIGTKAKDVKLVEFANNSGKSVLGYNYEGSIYKARPFTNGNVAFFGGNVAFKNSLLLETKNRQLKPFEFSGEYEWLSKCVNSLRKNTNYYPDDGPAYTDYNYDYANVSYIGGELACIKGNEIAKNFELTVNNVIRDTISLNVEITNWYGNYVIDYKKRNVYKIDTLNFKFDNSYTFEWGSSARYSAQDLMEFYK